MKSSTGWPIQRTWLSISESGSRQSFSSAELTAHPACVLLGSAGLGKTFELRRMARIESAAGKSVKVFRLAEMAQTAESLKLELNRLMTGVDADTTFYLDALDELMIPVRHAALIVATWVRDFPKSSRPALRISCRSAVWPGHLLSAITETFETKHVVAAMLQSLSMEDVFAIAQGRVIDPHGFVTAVEKVDVTLLAEQPLTLEMLLKLYESHKKLPQRRSELFAQGVEVLADERSERRDVDTTFQATRAEIIDTAQRLACYLLLAGKETVGLGEAPSETALNRIEIDLPETMMTAVRRSGLCEGSNNFFGFAHRQFAEYLAGQRISKLLLHQAQSFLSGVRNAQIFLIAGPLRETAAFAAAQSPKIAEWIAECDPEVIGLSEFADDALRKSATMRLVDKFKRGQLTAAFLSRGEIELKGLKYSGAEVDLKGLLENKYSGNEDVLLLAIELAESWQLSSLSELLVDFVLDSTAAISIRNAAGYALLKIGTAAARARLLPLASGNAKGDTDDELKGLALVCNWPDAISADQLLDFLTPSKRSNFFGAYQGFLVKLNKEGFDCAQNTLKALKWTRNIVAQPKAEHHFLSIDYNLRPIVKRIAVSALSKLDDADIACELAELMIQAAEFHIDPLFAPEQPLLQTENTEVSAPLDSVGSTVRRGLIKCIAACVTSDYQLWKVANANTGLLRVDDFAWLVNEALDPSHENAKRENFARLADRLPWSNSADNVDIWLNARNSEPIASVMNYPVVMHLGSPEAEKAKELYFTIHGHSERPKKPRLDPSPAERVIRVLSLSEQRDFRFFHDLTREMTLEESSSSYGFSRFLTQTPGWINADTSVKDRIVAAAKRFLDEDVEETGTVRSKALNKILCSGQAAIWLVMEMDLVWLDKKPTAWWSRWTYYILRGLIPNLSEENVEPKSQLLRMLCKHAPSTVREEFRHFATTSGEDAKNLVRSLLELMHEDDSGLLLDMLLHVLIAGTAPIESIEFIAEFVVSHDEKALSVIQHELSKEANISSGRAPALAVAMLRTRFVDAWDSVYGLIVRNSAVAWGILTRFARNTRSHWRKNESYFLTGMDSARIVQFASCLFDTFRPEDDPSRDGAYNQTSEDDARELRQRLISALEETHDSVSVVALNELAAKYANRYPWMRHPRARAEWAMRKETWRPLPVSVIREILSASERRLIRSSSDAADGILTAISQLERQVRITNPNDIENFWNIQKGQPSHPKAEERVSDIICDAILEYFKEYAVIADRETQLFRRKSPRVSGGASGSELDVFFTAPAKGTVLDREIKVPIEVKLAHNREAKSALKDQLFNRYMSQCDAEYGVYVVAWMGTGLKPLWRNPQDALRELQVDSVSVCAGQEKTIVVAVVDLSLPKA